MMIVFVQANSHFIITHVYVRKSRKAVKTSWCHATFWLCAYALCIKNVIKGQTNNYPKNTSASNRLLLLSPQQGANGWAYNSISILSRG